MLSNPFELINTRLIAIESLLTKPLDAIVNEPAEIINRIELCKRLDITEPTAIRWEKKGKIPSFRIGSNVRYNWINVISQLEGKTKGGVNYHG